MDRTSSLIKILEQIEKSFDVGGEIQNDPISLVLKYPKPEDQEVLAFIAALFSYGRVKQIKATLEKIFSIIGDTPYESLKALTGKDWKRRIPKNFRHRFHNHHDLGLLLTWIGEALRESQSLENFFASGHKQTFSAQLESFVERLIALESGPYSPIITRGLSFLLPMPSRKSACKRLLLFLRWVAGSGPMDLKLWKNYPRENLLIPVDTHVLRISRHLGLTQRKESSWKTSEEITASLKKLDPGDPTRFDFALCHMGISQECPSRFDQLICTRCRMNSLCLTFEKTKRSKN